VSIFGLQIYKLNSIFHAKRLTLSEFIGVLRVKFRFIFCRKYRKWI